MSSPALVPSPDLEQQLEQHRKELTGYCYRMLGSPFEAEDAVQETMLRAWRGFDDFEGRAALRSWLYRIATNVCVDMARGRARRATPMDFGPASPPVEASLNVPAEVSWLQPIPDSMLTDAADPSDLAERHETVRLAFVAALQHLPARQRAVLILFEVLRWSAAEIGELLGTSVASVNSALQRARATLQQRGLSADDTTPVVDDSRRELLARYVAAFQSYDVDGLTRLIAEDGRMSMPPYDLWLSGRDDILAWFFGPGIGCRGSRLVPVSTVNGGTVAYGQYKPSPSGSGYEPWSVVVLEIDGANRIVEFTFFLDTKTLYPLFGLPPRLDA
jgi:RNA polymerase sigma-70 factor (ECF subfamily)